MEKVRLSEAVSVGIGGMVGGGIFAVLGLAVSTAQGATPLAFLIAGVIAILTGYSYSRLALKIRNTGGTVEYVNKAFGRGVFSGGANNMLWFSYVIMLSLYASAFGSYAPNLLPLTGNSAVDYHIYLSGIILIATLINYLSVKLVSQIEEWAVVIKLVIILGFVALGLYGLKGSSYLSQLSPAQWAHPLSIISGGMLIFVAYEGFELVANVTPSMANPDRNIPRAFMYSILIVVALYILIAIITVGEVSFSQAAEARDYVLAVAAKPFLGQLGFTLIVIAALISTFSAINATIYGSSQVAYDIAADGELPHELMSQFKGKPLGLVITVIFALLTANLVPLEHISFTGSFGFLFIFLLVNISALRLRSDIGGNQFVYLSAIILTVAALIILIISQTEWLPVILSAAFLASSFLMEYLYKRFFTVQGR